MSFSLTRLIEQRQAEQYDLHARYISPHMARVQQIIGFDKRYVRGEGAYLWDADGQRYLDLLSGYSVFNLGRGHPVIRQAMQEALALERPNLVKMDCPLLAGLLAEALVQRMPPGLETVFFANSGADAVDTALKFARCATRRERIVYLDHAFHGLMLGTLSVNGAQAFRQGFEPLLPGTARVAQNDAERLRSEVPIAGAGGGAAQGRRGGFPGRADPGQGAEQGRTGTCSGTRSGVPMCISRTSSICRKRSACAASTGRC